MSAATGTISDLAPSVGEIERPPAGRIDSGGFRVSMRRALGYAGPAVALVVLTTYLPTVVALGASFFDVRLTGAIGPFVGVGNYADAVADPRVRQALVNSVVYLVLTAVPSLVIGLGLAITVNGLRRGRTVGSTLLFLPLTANLVAMSVVFRWIFATPGGFVNEALGLLGWGPVNFLGSADTALGAVASVGVWRQTSFSFLLFSSGLMSIPGAVDEAAATDGLAGWRKVRLVTLPMLRPTVVLATALAVLDALQAFDAVEVMTGGGPLGASELLLTIIWRIGFEYFDLAEAAALSIVATALLVAVGWARRSSVLSREDR